MHARTAVLLLAAVTLIDILNWLQITPVAYSMTAV